MINLADVAKWHEARAEKITQAARHDPFTCVDLPVAEHLAMAEWITLAAEVIAAAKMVFDVSKFAQFESGICCCGTEISRHSKDHLIVDSGMRYGDEAINRLGLALFQFSEEDSV